MRIVIKTLINRDFNTVVSGFNKNLFEYLTPHYCSLKRYDGQKHGDIVHVSFGLPGINDWQVVVKESGLTEKIYWFTHRGLKMPLAITFWNHMHRVVSIGKNKSAIVDHIEFKSKWKILDPLNYLILLIFFLPNKIFYRRYFHNRFTGQTAPTAKSGKA